MLGGQSGFSKSDGLSAAGSRTARHRGLFASLEARPSPRRKLQTAHLEKERKANEHYEIQSRG